MFGPHERLLGHIRDLAIRRAPRQYPPVVGAFVCLGGYDTYVPAALITAWCRGAINVHDLPPLYVPATPTRNTVLATDLLGSRFTAVGHGSELRARDLHLRRIDGRWAITTIDIRGGLARALGRQRGNQVDWAKSSLASSAHTCSMGPGRRPSL